MGSGWNTAPSQATKRVVMLSPVEASRVKAFAHSFESLRMTPLARFSSPFIPEEVKSAVMLRLSKDKRTEARGFHPIHVSTSNIEFNKQDNKFEVICSIFTDDFEAALAKQYNVKIDLSKPEMHKAMDALVQRYIASNLAIQADGKPVKLNYLGYEIDKEYGEVYLESDQLPPVKKVDVEVSLVYNLFDDQMNIVHIIVGGVRKSERVNNPEKKVEQVF